MPNVDYLTDDLNQIALDRKFRRSIPGHIKAAYRTRRQPSYQKVKRELGITRDTLDNLETAVPSWSKELRQVGMVVVLHTAWSLGYSSTQLQALITESCWTIGTTLWSHQDLKIFSKVLKRLRKRKRRTFTHDPASQRLKSKQGVAVNKRKAAQKKAEALPVLRQHPDWTQEELAHTVGVHVNTLRAYQRALTPSERVTDRQRAMVWARSLGASIRKVCADFESHSRTLSKYQTLFRTLRDTDKTLRRRQERVANVLRRNTRTPRTVAEVLCVPLRDAGRFLSQVEVGRLDALLTLPLDTLTRLLDCPASPRPHAQKEEVKGGRSNLQKPASSPLFQRGRGFDRGQHPTSPAEDGRRGEIDGEPQAPLRGPWSSPVIQSLSRSGKGGGSVGSDEGDPIVMPRPSALPKEYKAEQALPKKASVRQPLPEKARRRAALDLEGPRRLITSSDGPRRPALKSEGGPRHAIQLIPTGRPTPALADPDWPALETVQAPTSSKLDPLDEVVQLLRDVEQSWDREQPWTRRRHSDECDSPRSV